MNILSFPVMIGAGSYESQPRRFRCKRGHESVADAAPQIFVNGRVGSVLLCGACLLELLADTCVTEEIVQAPATYAPPAPPVGGPVLTTTATVVNPPIPFAEVLRRRQLAQGIKPPAPASPSPGAPPADAAHVDDEPAAAVAARPAPYTDEYRCLSHDQLGSAASEQFCPPDRFVHVQTGEPAVASVTAGPGVKT